jgi:predicted RND superfamily exporter protein
LSALTSLLEFAVMAFAPDPIFATFGTLTAVMIGLALIAAIVVLLRSLVMATPRREDQAVAEAEFIEVGPWRRRRRL